MNEAKPIRTKKSSTTQTIPIRIQRSTARKLKYLVQSCNRISRGQKIKADMIVAKALSLITNDHLTEIKESTFTSKDWIEVEYDKFCRLSGKISKDEFMKKLLQAGLPSLCESHETPHPEDSSQQIEEFHSSMKPGDPSLRSG